MNSGSPMIPLSTRGSKTPQRNVIEILEGRVKSEVVLTMYPDGS
jgi:hypothetical protein